LVLAKDKVTNCIDIADDDI